MPKAKHTSVRTNFVPNPSSGSRSLPSVQKLNQIKQFELRQRLVQAQQSALKGTHLPCSSFLAHAISYTITDNRRRVGATQQTSEAIEEHRDQDDSLNSAYITPFGDPSKFDCTSGPNYYEPDDLDYETLEEIADSIRTSVAAF